MRNIHKAFWISFAVYSLLTFLATVVIERNENDLGFLINMKGYIPLMKYYTLVGLLFYLVAFGLMFKSRLKIGKMTSEFDLDKKELKAKISDLKRLQKAASGADENIDSPKPEE
jgi:hypothetical protein